ncbi:hypothetical protein ASE95_06115 [Sphingomonas sp. Leaf231]|uniref:Crp/Fnr family transcriptional regulator n=1 Tax=Sphingomonas sp. Leaf231 TaxID=1736301 RepID=UPI0006F9BFEA|nr:Crp/Fnr family transcriptional regulator [Sphingomonas sp. Leaf231]KQN94397.1 hypothetical protein ASE95_06115 [Sphingomonas sp. Leaf231]
MIEARSTEGPQRPVANERADVSHSAERYSTNILLEALSPQDLELLKPHLVREELHRGKVLLERGQPIWSIWFPEGGVASIISETTDHGRTEVGIFGREGFAGTPALLGENTSPHEIFIQVDGPSALRIETSRFLAAVEESATLRRIMLRYVQTFLVQAAHSAVSNAHQRIEARLARWLLMCHDRHDGDEIPLTHEFMAMMIAAERSSVTMSLHVLEGAGMIRATRGLVRILDRQKLEDLTGEAYGQAEADYRRLIGPFGKHHPRRVPVD